MSERVVITGLGVVSSLGLEIDEFWKNLVSGKSGITKVESFDTSGLERSYAGEVKGFDPSEVYDEFETVARTHQFAAVSSLLALKDAKIEDTCNLGLIIGSLAGGIEVIEGVNKDYSNYPVQTVTAHVCNLLGIRGYATTLSCACAAGNYSISLAYERIKHKQDSIVLAGGADYFSMSIFLSFYKMFSLSALKCQPFDKNRRGLLPAEGAGMLVLESLSSAKKRKAHIYAEVLGYGMSVDAYHPVIPSAEGFYNCMENAISASGLKPCDIDHINAHGTGTIPNDSVESVAIKKLFKDKYKKIPVTAIKSMLGHTMGAASAIEAISCCLTFKNNLIPPTINYETPDPECDIDCVGNQARKHRANIILNNSFGFGGTNCTVVLAAYRPKGGAC